MKSQSFVVLASLCSLVMLVSITEAGIFGRRQSYSNSRPTYTYRPATTTSAAKPAAPPQNRLRRNRPRLKRRTRLKPRPSAFPNLKHHQFIRQF